MVPRKFLNRIAEIRISEMSCNLSVEFLADVLVTVQDLVTQWLTSAVRNILCSKN